MQKKAPRFRSSKSNRPVTKSNTHLAPRHETHSRARAREAEPKDGHDVLIRALPPWKRRFIESLRKMPNLDLACRMANCSRATAYRHKADDDLFSQLWKETLEGAFDAAEGALFEEGVMGRERVTTQTKKDGSSTTMRERVREIRATELLLKANRPAKYRERFEVKAEVAVDPLNAAVMNAIESGAMLELARKLTERFGAKIFDAEMVSIAGTNP